jgi:hypothetical protein
MLLSIVLFFGIWFRLSIFLLIELPTILFAVWRETKQTRKYQGDYLAQNPLRFLHINDARFVFISSCLWEGARACLVYVVCVFVWCPSHIMLCFVLVFCFACFRLVCPWVQIIYFMRPIATEECWICHQQFADKRQLKNHLKA